jgi:hypothetical protein
MKKKSFKLKIKEFLKVILNYAYWSSEPCWRTGKNRIGLSIQRTNIKQESLILFLKTKSFWAPPFGEIYFRKLGGLSFWINFWNNLRFLFWMKFKASYIKYFFKFGASLLVFVCWGSCCCGFWGLIKTKF